MSSRNGHSGRYTCEQFIAAIPGTGGIISAICDRVGCSWHTAKKYIDDHSTVLEAWEAERNRITDKARHNIIKAIHDGDVQTSKWWLQVMDEDFVPREKRDVTSGGKPFSLRFSQITVETPAGDDDAAPMED